MEQKEFIEVNTGNSIAMISLSSIAAVEQNGNGTTIILKEMNKDKIAYVILSSTDYYTIKGKIESYHKI